VTENDRVRRTVAAFAAGDLDAVGRLFEAGHASLRDDFEVTVPETDLLTDLLVRHGARAARMTGGGFGGAVVALVEGDPDDAAAVAAATVADYRRTVPERVPQVLVTAAGAGAAERAPGLVRR
jgi:galactokinase